MRIAILGSISTKIPPVGQAAIERLAYYQAEGLGKKGHQILLFALSGSNINSKNVKVIEVGQDETLSGIGKEGKSKGEDLYGSSYKLRLEIVNLAHVIKKLIELKENYDLVLNNLRGEAVLIPLLSFLNKPLYHILHLPIFPQLADLFRKYQTRLISISNAQRKFFKDLNYIGTVYNGVDTSKFAFSPVHKNYLLYLGSIGPNKNPKEAILAAKAAGETILIGGRIKDQAYFNQEIAPLVDENQVQWIGEKHLEEVIKLYQGAKAFLFPTRWQEPFGLVIIEALSCGTPVIAYPNGAVPEIIKDGENGFLVTNVSEMALKIKEIDKIKRLNCRKSVEKQFSIETMVSTYETILIKSLNH